jgi:hypothetical protein
MLESLLGAWGGSLKCASFFGYLCFAPGQGQQARFTHPATWLHPPPAPVEPAAAFDAFTAGYLATHGPATAHDLGPRWWGVNQTEAKRRLAALGERATQVAIGSGRYWMRSADLAELEAAEPLEIVRLLPAFDPWVICASPREPALLDPAHRGKVYRPQGWVSPVLLVNGRMAGVWKHEQKGATVSVEVQPFGKLPRRTREPIEGEAERLAAFLGGSLDLKIQR